MWKRQHPSRLGNPPLIKLFHTYIGTKFWGVTKLPKTISLVGRAPSAVWPRLLFKLLLQFKVTKPLLAPPQAAGAISRL